MKHTRRTFIKSAAATAVGVELLKPAGFLGQGSATVSSGEESRTPLAAASATTNQPARRAWQSGRGILTTPWTEHVTPEKVWPKYPRPQMTRRRWLNLNGLWNYQVTQKEQTHAPTDYAGEILVPFCIESPLSGVMKPLLPVQRLWYEREVVMPADWEGQRVLLHFGAVDWEKPPFTLTGESSARTGEVTTVSVLTSPITSRRDSGTQ